MTTEIYLNVSQLSHEVKVSTPTIRERIRSGRLLPDAVDAKGHALFAVGNLPQIISAIGIDRCSNLQRGTLKEAVCA